MSDNEDRPDVAMAVGLENNAVVHCLLMFLRQKKLISNDELHDLYDAALLMLEHLQGVHAGGSATMTLARQQLEALEKAARTARP